MKSIILIALVCLLHCTVINYASDQNCPTTSTTSISSYTSPINFDYYNSKNMKFPGYPKFVLNSTYYTPINNKPDCSLYPKRASSSCILRAYLPRT